MLANIVVEVAYALPEKQYLQSVKLEEGATVEQRRVYGPQTHAPIQTHCGRPVLLPRSAGRPVPRDLPRFCPESSEYNPSHLG